MQIVDSKTVHSYRNQRETCCFRILGAIKGCPLLGPYLKPISAEVFAIVAVPAMIQIVQECQEIRRCSPCGAESYRSANIYSFMLTMLMLFVFGVIQKVF